MKVAACIAIATLAAASATASAATVMRVGETGVETANLEKTSTIAPRVLARTAKLRISLTGSGQVEDFELDQDYNRVSRGMVMLTPEVSGRWRITCERRKPYDYASSAGSLVVNRTITRTLPMKRPSTCKVEISAFATGAGSWPDEDRVTVVQALVTTIPVAKARKRAK